MRIRVRINGRTFEHDVEPRLLLVHYIRQLARLTSSHIGCDTGNRGACTVLVEGKAVKSCLMLAVQADGRDIVGGAGGGREREHGGGTCGRSRTTRTGRRRCHGGRSSTSS